MASIESFEGSQIRSTESLVFFSVDQRSSRIKHFQRFGRESRSSLQDTTGNVMQWLKLVYIHLDLPQVDLVNFRVEYVS